MSVVFGILTLATISASFCNGNLDNVVCKKSERQALLSFKQDLKDSKNRLSTWAGTEGDCCTGTGVVCDNSTGQVIELHLGTPSLSEAEYFAHSSYKFGGKLNPSLLNLEYLNYLDLSYNDFSGIQIPSFIGSLKSLTYLNLSESGFGGTIPHQLGNLSSLRYLGLGGRYEGSLEVENLHWISELSLLQHLDMSGADLSKAFDWLRVINKLSSLVELRLS